MHYIYRHPKKKKKDTLYSQTHDKLNKYHLAINFKHAIIMTLDYM